MNILAVLLFPVCNGRHQPFSVDLNRRLSLLDKMLADNYCTEQSTKPPTVKLETKVKTGEDFFKCKVYGTHFSICVPCYCQVYIL